MIGCPQDELALQRFIAEIGTLPPRPHHTGLLAVARQLVPECGFSFALSQGGWYRPGGVIRADGTRLTDDLERWAEQELATCDGDIEALLEQHDGEELLATRHAGVTHYFVAQRGNDPADFVQLEVEELQEVLDRQLIDVHNPPEDLAELTDPAVPRTVHAQPVGRSRYRYRALTDMRQALARQPAPVGGPSPLGRFMAEWQASSADRHGHFSDHWIVALREHHDRCGNTVLHATPVSRHARALKPFHWQPEARGVAMSEQLHAFDRAAGYPAAWYFHLVAGALTPRLVAQAIAQDLEADFGYLPEADAKLLAGWLMAPYTV